ncbi:MAG TPA: helix-turn-helix domain-containing protein [Streptosporangiaceae bacterium]
MRIEAGIGKQIARLREARQMSLTQLGEALEQYLGKPWSRQAVHQAERGSRAFTAAEIAALALALETSVPALFLAGAEQIELPGAVILAEDYQAILLHARDDAPLDGIEELLVALHDISQILSRPALARLAKIEQVAEQVASVIPPPPSPPADPTHLSERVTAGPGQRRPNSGGSREFQGSAGAYR